MEWREKEKINNAFPASFVKAALHCIGMDHRPPYRKVGKIFYKPFRNCVILNEPTAEIELWEQAVLFGIAWHEQPDLEGSSLHHYGLTEKGFDWLGELINITMRFEEDE